MARFEFKDPEFDKTWDDMSNMAFYNKIKSPTVEDIINGRKIVNDIVECRQVIVRHIITIQPCKDYFCVDEQGMEMPLFDKDGRIVINYKDIGEIYIDIPGFEQWYNVYLDAIANENIDTTPSYNYEEWERNGFHYLQSLRNVLPDSIDLWYQPPKECTKEKQEEKPRLIYRPYVAR